jgi:hypothetical protein
LALSFTLGTTGCKKDEKEEEEYSTTSSKDHEVEITDPLRVEIGCPWLVSGDLEVRPEGLSSRVVDYGDGNCDSKVVVTVNGNQHEIYVN